MNSKEARKILNRHKKSLTHLGAQSLSLFGSVARDEGSPTSDIDILVEFDAKKGLFGFVDLKNHLKTLLGCKVDLVIRNGLHLALRKKILHEAKSVF